MSPEISPVAEAHEGRAPMDLLRFATAGSVDDGKSTLIGRLLYDTRQIFDDQMASLEADSKRVGTQGQAVDFALLVDGLAAEREQGITIDVAYRYFATPARKFIIADTPGHVQYTRNMVTGASTADLALVLVDARNGVVRQSRRHAFISSLLRIPQSITVARRTRRIASIASICGAISARVRAPARATSRAKYSTKIIPKPAQPNLPTSAAISWIPTV